MQNDRIDGLIGISPIPVVDERWVLHMKRSCCGSYATGNTYILESFLEITTGISMFQRAFFNSIIDKYQHMHFFTFNTVLV
jgi:hypothetical protein